MAWWYKQIHKHPNAGINWLQKNPQNIAGKGRPPSFKKHFQKLLSEDGFLVFSKEQIIEIKENWSVKVKMPKEEAIVMKAINWALSNKGIESTKMIQWIVEMFEWKAITPTKDLTPVKDPSKKELELLDKIL